VIGSEQLTDWRRDGFFILRDFAPASVTTAMLDRVIEIARETEGAIHEAGMLITPESNLQEFQDSQTPAEERVSKIFRLHRDPVFNEFIRSEAVEQILAPLLGAAVDCFLSQFIFKNPGAWGQPWHQDEHYFAFDRHPQVGLWLAITEATHENGCLQVLPGSHQEPVHEHIADRRPSANFGYLEIVDHDFGDAVPVLMQRGDLLVFHSRLMHSSRDNESSGVRAAMVYHFSEHGTVDQMVASPVNDWLQLTPAQGKGKEKGKGW
jgi:ectoine hydroxylase-related dioxygenase (phytanoyl-CoA dioxygenase family)